MSLAAALMHAPAALADAVLDWNEIGLARLLAARQTPPEGARSLAMMHVAMFDAIDAVDRKYRPYAHEQRAARAVSAEAAGIAAAATVLGKLS